jgi:hypothetical protein
MRELRGHDSEFSRLGESERPIWILGNIS